MGEQHEGARVADEVVPAHRQELAGQTGHRAAGRPEPRDVRGTHRHPFEDVDDIERDRAVGRQDACGGVEVVTRVELGGLLDRDLAAHHDEVVGHRGKIRNVGQGGQAHEREGSSVGDGRQQGLDSVLRRVRPGRHAYASESVGSVVRRALARAGPRRGPAGADAHRHVGGAGVRQDGGGVARRHLRRHVADHGRHAAEIEGRTRDGVEQREGIVDPGVDVEHDRSRARLGSLRHDLRLVARAGPAARRPGQ